MNCLVSGAENLGKAEIIVDSPNPQTNKKLRFPQGAPATFRQKTGSNFAACFLFSFFRRLNAVDLIVRYVLTLVSLFWIAPVVAQQLDFARRSVSEAVIPAELRSHSTAAEQMAIRIAGTVASSLNLPANADFQPIATRRIGNLWHTSFKLSYFGIRVRDAALATDIGVISGRLVNATQRLPLYGPNSRTPTFSTAQVRLLLRQYLGSDSLTEVLSVSTLRLVFVQSRGTRSLRLAYETTVHQRGHEWRITVDALSGLLIEKKEMLEFIGGEGPEPLRIAKGLVRVQIHRHSPYEFYDTVALPYTHVNIFDSTGKKLLSQTTTDSLGFWSATVPAGSFVKSEFTGPYETVVRHDDDDHSRDTAWFGFSDTLTWSDYFSNAAERDAYYHTSVARAYAHRIDTALGAVDSLITINVNLDLSCNAFYSPDAISLNFFHSSSKCSNTGEIADVIYHEFGHRVAHVRYTGSANGNLVNNTLGEGFADLYSAFLRDDPRIAIGFYAGQATRCLRTCDNRMSFPDSISADPHISGQIISGAFWDLRKVIGHDAAERIFHAVEWLTPDAPDETSPTILKQAFIETLTDALLVDDDDNDLSNGTPHSDALLAAFAKHGITLASLIHLVPEVLSDQEITAEGYPITLKACYHGPFGAIDPSSLSLHYSTGKGLFVTQDFGLLHDSTYQSVIPKQLSGTIVSYYVSAHLLGDTLNSTTWPRPSQALRFSVGYTQRYYDDCESDRGWSLNDAADNATHGLWTRDTPYGTYNVSSEFVQQDTDHSLVGVNCYITGNAHNPDVNFDDVDSGSATLTTNAIDVRAYNSPLLRYWYYYSNDQGDHPGEPQLTVEISADDGSHWKTVLQSRESTQGWTSNLIRVSDYVTPSSRVKLRFSASDYVGAIVEAGVDDIEALSAPEGVSSTVLTSEVTSVGITAIHPNPSSKAQISIDYSIPAADHVTLDIRNVMGDRMMTLEDRMMSAGSYRSVCPSLQTGTYWVVLSTPSSQSVHRLVVQ